MLEADNALSDAFQPYGIHHCGQTMEHVVLGYAKVRNLSFVEVGAGSDVGAVRQALGPEVFMNLRYSPVELMTVDANDMRRQLTSMVAHGGPYHLLSTSCVGIDKDTSDERMKEFLRINCSL